MEAQRGDHVGSLSQVLRRRAALTLGCAAVVGTSVLLGADIGLSALPSSFDLLATAIMAVVLLPIIARNARRPEHRALYPQARLDPWSGRDTATNLVSWGLYLLAYEAFFRGTLLLGLVPLVGTSPAVLASVTLYTAVHARKELPEIIGCIPFGLAVAWTTLHSGTIWTAFGVHWAIASTNFLVSRPR